MKSKVILNPDKDYVKEIKYQLRQNNNHCPCKLEKTPETKCMCAEFRKFVKAGGTGQCDCGLYIAEGRNSDEN